MKISEAIDGKSLNITAYLNEQSDIISPAFLAVRYELDPETRAIKETSYILTSYLNLITEYKVNEFFSVVPNEVKVDTFQDDIIFKG